MSPEKLPTPEEEKSIETIGINIIALNQELLIKHASYFERPINRRFMEIPEPRSALYDEFGELIQAVHNDDELTNEHRAAMLTVTLMELRQDHLTLLADYTDDIEPFDDSTYNYAFKDMKDELLSASNESQSAFIDKAVSLFGEAVDFDWEVVSGIYDKSYQYKLDKLRSAGEIVAHSVAKVAIGAMLGMILSDKMRKK